MVQIRAVMLHLVGGPPTRISRSEEALAEHTQPLPSWLKKLVAQRASHTITHWCALLTEQGTAVAEIVEVAAVFPLGRILGFQDDCLLHGARGDLFRCGEMPSKGLRQGVSKHAWAWKVAACLNS